MMLTPTPSRAHLWSKCSAYLEMAFKHRDVENAGRSPDSGEGLAAHALAADILTKGDILEAAPAPDAYLGREYFGHPVDQDMFDHVSEYVLDVVETISEYGSDSLSGAEVRMGVPGLSESLDGVVDAYYYSPGHSVMYLWDFKYGRRPVEAYENPQLLMYASMVLEHLKIPFHEIKNIEIHMVIIQPRIYRRTRKEWVLRGDRALKAYADMTSLYEFIKGGAREATPGGHCRDCPAKIHCESALTAAEDYSGMVSEMPDVGTLSNSQLAHLNKKMGSALDILRKMIETSESEIVMRIKKGEVVPGYEMERSQGREQWSVENDALITFADQALSIDLRKKTEVITPAQARKKLKSSKMPDSLLDMFAHRSTSEKLVQININHLKEDFKNGN